MQNANLACPLCRVRIGSWYRIAKKEKRLINAQLWDVVREKFSKQLENKSKGIDVVTPQGKRLISDCLLFCLHVTSFRTQNSIGYTR